MTLASDRFITETYREYVGVKLHFNDNKFIYKNPSQFAKLKPEQLKKRNDKEWFYKLANMFIGRPQERLNYIVTQFKDNKDAWIGDFFRGESIKNHNIRMKHIQSFDYYINTELDNILIKYADCEISKVFSVNNDRPLIYREMKLSDEMLSILDYIFKFDDNSINPLWANKLFSCRKYFHFLNIGDNKINIIENKIKNSLVESSGDKDDTQNNTLENLFN